MKAACPRCGRGTELDQEVGDFPTRCTRCGALVRRRGEPSAEPETPAAQTTRIQRGMLAGLLTSRRQQDAGLIQAHGGAAVMEPNAEDLSEGQSPGILRPESRREILRARARQQALARAELRSNQQAPGALTWAGLALVLILGIGALALKAHALWSHPAPARADVLRVE